MKIPKTRLTSHTMSKSSYLHQMTSDPKNKGILFSSTLKVGEIKVDLFSWSEFILVSYDDFVVSERYQKTPHKLKRTNSSYLLQITSDLKNEVTFFFKFNSLRKQCAFIFYIRCHLREIWAFCHFVTCEGGFWYLHEIK